VCWQGGSLCICSRCCQRIKDGLMADLIQVAATMDLRGLRQLCGHNAVTLVRSWRQDLEAEGDKERQAWRQAERSALRPVGEVVYTRDLKVPIVEGDTEFKYGWKCIPQQPATASSFWEAVDTSKDYKTGWRRLEGADEK
jgi:hypothetical protein